VSNFNPYEAPKSDVAPRAPFLEAGDGLWRDGPLLVMRKDAELPDRCVKCNTPAEGRRLRRNLSWHPGAWYLLVLVSLPIYVIVALIVRKTARIEVGLCADHRARRRRAIAVGWALSLAGFGMIIYGASVNRGDVALIGVVPLLAGLIFGLIGSQTVVASRIDKNLVWLKKVHPSFLAELRDWGDFDALAKPKQLDIL
jgi:hypothetical protein